MRRPLAACESRWAAAEAQEEDAQEVETEHLWPRARGGERALPASGGGGGCTAAVVVRAALVLVAAAFFLSAWSPSRWSPRGRKAHRSLEGRGDSGVVGANEISGGPGGDEGAKIVQLMGAPPLGGAEGTTTTFTVTLGGAGGTTTTFTVTLTTFTKTSRTRTEQPISESSQTSQTWTVTETSQTWREASTATTTATVFWDRLPPSDFPEIMYLTVPESETDAKRMKQMKEEVIRYLPENRWGVRIIPGVVPELWPEGRYDRVFKYGQMLPKKRLPHKEGPPRPPETRRAETSRRAECMWTSKGEGGLYDHYFDAAPGANTLDTCKDHCCHDPECKAIRFSPSAVDGPELQCLLYQRGLVAWSLERPLYEDYRVHLLDDADSAVLAEGASSSSSSPEEEDEGEDDDEEEVGMPWWDIRNLNMARVTSTGRHPDDHDAWPAHHCGCSLSHLTMWMEALRRGVQNLAVFESDGFLSCVQNWRVGGNASDFADLVTALPSRAPEDWHLIVLDKGEFGAEPGAPPVAAIRPASGGGNRSYSLIPWKGRGVAGAAAYMVSRRFLEWFPRDIQKHGFNMVDAWIGSRCSREPSNPSPINCYSILAEGHKAE